ncbi:MAG: serine hydrolase [Candidatus Latescibacterota bacterium]|nr:MAG: serine hydrolase [Candidatus Latescibacterota bacterium]
MDTISRLLIFTFPLMLFAGCATEAKRDLSRAPAKSDDGWNVASPTQYGANIALLDSMIRRTEVGHYVNIHSVLVVKDGVLVLEEYFDGKDSNTLHEIRSATKSIGSILTGMAIDKGFIASENESVYKFFENDYEPADGWTDRAKRVEIRHLLSMMSGYECDDLATNFACEHAMHDSNDWVQYSLDLPFACSPGERWAYNSSSLILVGEAVARASGLEVDAFADRFLFEPLGIERFHWQFSPKRRAWMGGGARMIPREMAKIGQLMLNRGTWNDQRLLSKEWIEKSTTKQGEMLTGVDYGYLWQRGWSYIGRELVTAYWASGNGGQYIVVLPDIGMVVVFTGGNYDSPLASQPFQMLTDYILPAFLHPTPLEAVILHEQEINRITGTYHLDFEPSATSTVSTQEGQIRLLSPDGESIDLVAHSPSLFTGGSQYGRVTVVFEADNTGKIVKHTIYGSFQRFVFERE